VTPLERALTERIKADGPLPVAAWMEACNTYYYATRDPLGAGGDFTTAPEISQMYGEMIGAALADCWARTGRPMPVRYAEIGPGRGTLAADALRVMRAAGCDPAAVELVETSPVLRGAQAAAVPEARFHDDIGGLAAGDGPLLVVASEFFDALPVEQRVGGVERRVEWIGGHFAFDRDGTVVETSPAREGAMAELARVLVAKGGVAVVVDYGHQAGSGDTLQAVGGHRFASPLEKPGEQDLTAHVDFAALRAAAEAAGARVSRLVSQGTWLETLGIAARAMALAAANPGEAEAVAAARRRLCDDEAMGRLFKVIAVAAPGWPLPAGLE
jgi:NADH dehydrogenase [ubiquinone] 1 alpha subcomplex assembly factor 7